MDALNSQDPNAETEKPQTQKGLAMKVKNPIAKALRDPHLHQRRLPGRKREKLESPERILDDHEEMSERDRREMRRIGLIR